jgi:hypothetical protein
MAMSTILFKGAVDTKYKKILTVLLFWKLNHSIKEDKNKHKRRVSATKAI